MEGNMETKYTPGKLHCSAAIGREFKDEARSVPCRCVQVRLTGLKLLTSLDD